MVRHPSSRGASKLGCLVTRALFVGALYYGAQVGQIYWRYYSFRDEMATAARFASTRSDQSIRRTLRAKVTELGLPPEAADFTVRRSGPPMRMVIETEYREVLRFPRPFRPYEFVFRPRVEWRF